MWFAVGKDLTDVNIEQHGVSIGKPVANVKIHIVNKHLLLQPVGVPGELLIEGVQVAKGYLNRPSLSAEKFIPSPFHNNERVYRTGDLARWLANGEIDYIGRMDNQVKIRGNRIELGEIESTLSLVKELDAVVVLAREFDSGDKSLVARIWCRVILCRSKSFHYQRMVKLTERPCRTQRT